MLGMHACMQLLTDGDRITALNGQEELLLVLHLILLHCVLLWHTLSLLVAGTFRYLFRRNEKTERVKILKILVIIKNYGLCASFHLVPGTFITLLFSSCTYSAHLPNDYVGTALCWLVALFSVPIHAWKRSLYAFSIRTHVKVIQIFFPERKGVALPSPHQASGTFSAQARDCGDSSSSFSLRSNESSLGIDCSTALLRFRSGCLFEGSALSQIIRGPHCFEVRFPSIRKFELKGFLLFLPVLIVWRAEVVSGVLSHPAS